MKKSSTTGGTSVAKKRNSSSKTSVMKKASAPKTAEPEGVYEAVARKRDNIVGNLTRVPLAAEYEEALARMENHLRTHGKRCTIERRFVLQTLYQLTQPIDIGTLHDLICNECGNVSLTTVYSTLELLEQLHLARRLDLISHGMAFFERTLGLEPHVYVVCGQCGMLTTLPQPDLQAMLQPKMPRGFAASGYTLVVRGTCSKCSRKGRPRRKKE